MVYRRIMSHDQPPSTRSSHTERLRRLVIWAIIIAVPWVPGGVALAMVLSGKAGH